MCPVPCLSVAGPPVSSPHRHCGSEMHCMSRVPGEEKKEGEEEEEGKREGRREEGK